MSIFYSPVTVTFATTMLPFFCFDKLSDDNRKNLNEGDKLR